MAHLKKRATAAVLGSCCVSVACAVATYTGYLEIRGPNLVSHWQFFQYHLH